MTVAALLCACGRVLCGDELGNKTVCERVAFVRWLFSVAVSRGARLPRGPICYASAAAGGRTATAAAASLAVAQRGRRGEWGNAGWCSR